MKETTKIALQACLGFAIMNSVNIGFDPALAGTLRSSWVHTTVEVLCKFE